MLTDSIIGEIDRLDAIGEQTGRTAEKYRQIFDDLKGYELRVEDLLSVFRLVNNYLDPKGIFIFDLNTIYKYEELLGDATIAENREESSFIWENTYYEEDRVNEYDLTLFIREEDGRYQKYEETHYQKAYVINIIITFY